MGTTVRSYFSLLFAVFLIATFAVIGCGGSTNGDTLVLASYTTPREVFSRALLPKFKGKTGPVTFEESYQGSGAQSRAVAEGFEADVVALSLAPDVQRLVDAGLVDATWDDDEYGGMITRSIVVIAVRPGNPKGIHDWADLAREGVEVLTPNVRTSGGAMWNIAAIHGAAKRGATGGMSSDDLLAGILRNVKVMDKGARESLVTFESGVGDAAITYENEARLSIREGRPLEYVVPRATIRIESPAAVVDTYAKAHGRVELARSFVAFLREPESQKAFVEYGFRPVLDSVPTPDFPAVTDLFTVTDLGGWSAVQTELFAPKATYDTVMERIGK